jgi:AcrR family transcriptional regulator
MILFNVSVNNHIMRKEKQIQIIQAAEKLFAENGYEGTSIRHIAAAAGVNVSMISYYFGSKEKLIEALFEERIGYIGPQIENLLKDRITPPMKKVEILLDEYITSVFNNQLFYRIMAAELATQNNAVLVSLINRLSHQQAGLVAQLLKDGQRQKIFRKDVDLLFILGTLVGTVNQLVLSNNQYWKYKNGKVVPAAMVQQKFRVRLRNYLNTLFKAMLLYET